MALSASAARAGETRSSGAAAERLLKAAGFGISLPACLPACLPGLRRRPSRAGAHRDSQVLS